MSLDYRPLGIAAVIGFGDGVLDPAGGNEKIPHAHLLYRLGVLGLGAFGSTGERPSGATIPPTFPGRWDPNISQSMVVAAAALLGTSIPGALAGGGLAAFGDVVSGYAARGRSQRRRGGDPRRRGVELAA